MSPRRLSSARNFNGDNVTQLTSSDGERCAIAIADVTDVVAAGGVDDLEPLKTLRDAASSLSATSSAQTILDAATRPVAPAPPLDVDAADDAIASGRFDSFGNDVAGLVADVSSPPSVVRFGFVSSSLSEARMAIGSND